MRFDREGVVFKTGDGFYWPFPKLRFRLRNGYWCEHVRPIPGGPTFVVPGDEWCLSMETEPAWVSGDGERRDGWRMIEAGMRQMRRCGGCEFR